MWCHSDRRFNSSFSPPATATSIGIRNGSRSCLTVRTLETAGRFVDDIVHLEFGTPIVSIRSAKKKADHYQDPREFPERRCALALPAKSWLCWRMSCQTGFAHNPLQHIQNRRLSATTDSYLSVSAVRLRRATLFLEFQGETASCRSLFMGNRTSLCPYADKRKNKTCRPPAGRPCCAPPVSCHH
jgi:hypothetical protein